MNLPSWAREPLVHFMIGGAALFTFFAWQGEPADPASRTITVTREDRALLALQWEQTMQRPPTDAELDSMVETFLREEVLYREALRLGLDRDDPVVRKRLANKMDYLAASMAETAPVSDATLRQYYADHPERFAGEVHYSFDQLYFAEKADAKRALTGPKSGQSISLPGNFTRATRGEIAGRLGSQFVDALDSMAVGKDWAGPHASGFGWHLIRLTRREASQVPPFDDIRDQVEADWRSSTEADRREQAYHALRDAYRIKIAR